ncbi:protein of unknown function [Cupriavidus taiwanensis]|uniref:Uncharacterized protein n=1 Tax=Cupriavidus taiwanensis TaxID=164546 RepID=A0A7Z7NLN1_9BURK|nr:protein of unknown function [Cupriavidus taiwanensis]SOZ01561.1 hypothetical protein CBM2595_A30418 [Cupriavidus taiwanensis]SPC09092.1 hypothetical protein CBM2594_A40415 [Cupriavidus taiwanensis]SPD38885.1 protein of unknown function [Cupriavidus taiwanensis]
MQMITPQAKFAPAIAVSTSITWEQGNPWQIPLLWSAMATRMVASCWLARPAARSMVAPSHAWGTPSVVPCTGSAGFRR